MNLIDSQQFNHFKVLCSDGELGHIKDFYFDEDWFFLRYLIVDTSLFLMRHLVLVSPISFDYIDPDKEEIHLNLSKQELENSPPFGQQETVSMLYERAYHQHFAWPYYGKYHLSPWSIGPYGVPWPYYESGNNSEGSDIFKESESLKEDAKKTRLRSARELRGYSLYSTELSNSSNMNSNSNKVSLSGKKFGHIQGFIIDTIKYSVEYFVVDTINYWPSKLVTLMPELIKDISWFKKEVSFRLPKDIIVNSPSYHRNNISKQYFETVNKYFESNQFHLTKDTTIEVDQKRKFL